MHTQDKTALQSTKVCSIQERKKLIAFKKKPSVQKSIKSIFETNCFQ